MLTLLTFITSIHIKCLNFNDACYLLSRWYMITLVERVILAVKEKVMTHLIKSIIVKVWSNNQFILIFLTLQ